MITYYIILFFLSIFYILTSPMLLLPAATLPGSIETAILEVANYLSYVNLMIPINELLKVLIFILGVEAGFLIFKLIKVIIRG